MGLNSLVETPTGVWIQDSATNSLQPEGCGEESRLEHVRQAITGAKDISTYSLELEDQITDWLSEYHLSGKRTNLLQVFDLSQIETVMELGCECGAITRALGEAGFSVEAIEEQREKAEIAQLRCRDLPNVKIISARLKELGLSAQQYDLVFCAEFLSNAQLHLPSLSSQDAILAMLKRLRAALRPGGILIVATENRLGTKYLLGGTEDSVGKPFAGIYGYPGIENVGGYSKKEWESICTQSDFSHHRFVYPFPDNKLPTVLLTDFYTESSRNLYAHLSQVTSRDYVRRISSDMNESILWKVFAEAKMVGDFSNSFLTVLSDRSDSIERVMGFDFVHISDVHRRPIYRTVTRKPRGESVVVKQRLIQNVAMDGNEFLVHKVGKEKFVDGTLLSQVWVQTLSIWEDIDRFEKLVGEYFAFLQSVTSGEENQSCALDLLPSNIVIDEQQNYQAIDTEWVIEKKPQPEFILFRGLLHFVNQNRRLFVNIFTQCGYRRVVEFVAHCFSCVSVDLYRNLDTFVEMEDRIQRVVLKDAQFVNTRNELEQDIGEHKYHPRVSWRGPAESFSNDRMVSVTASFGMERQRLNFKLPRGLQQIEALRFDVADVAGFFHIHSIELSFVRDGGSEESILCYRSAREVALGASLVGMEYRDGPIGDMFVSVSGDPQILLESDGCHHVGENGRYVFVAEVSWPKSIDYLIAKSSFIRDETELRERVVALEKLQRSEKELRGELTLIKQSKAWRLIESLRHSLYTSVLGKVPRLQKTALGLTRKRMDTMVDSVPDTTDIYEKFKALQQLQKGDSTKKGRAIENFTKKPKVSLIMPVYNVDPQWLDQAISSVRAQIYSNWELCIVDDCSSSQDTIRLLNHINDPQVKIRYLKKNKNISGATNEAIGLSCGDYIGFLDHDDLLTDDALYEVVKAINNSGADLLYSDEDFIDQDGNRINPHFKPGFSPDLLLSHNYITHFLVVKRELLSEVGMFRSAYDGAQDYDFVLRASEYAKNVYHIPKILYHWRMTEHSTSLDAEVKPGSSGSARRALEDAMSRRRTEATVLNANLIHFFHVKREIEGEPLVSIVIPFKDKSKLLETCFEAILTKSTYRNFELIGISNNSEGADTFHLMREYESRDSRIRFVELNIPFNFSAIANHGVSVAQGEHVVLMNNDIEVMSWDWIEALLQHSQRDEIGVVGGKLYFSDNTIQHAGIVVGIGGYAGHPHKNFAARRTGYFNKLNVIHNVSAVTGAFMMVEKRIFQEVDGFDQEHLQIACNDVDFCLRVLNRGYYNLFTPYAEAYHRESSSRGYEDTAEKKARFDLEKRQFLERHRKFVEAGDPFYNENLSLDDENYSLRV